jgi:membrane protein implicated in regulation of membrane protease activity
MIDVPVDDLVFIVCTLVGGGLLLITVLLDDIVGGLFDVLHIDFDIGGVSLVPLLLGFVSMFGVGGLFATQVLDVRGGQAAIVGTVSGLIGFSIVYVMFNLLRKSEGANPFSTSSLVGRSASVAVDIPAGRRGTVLVKAEGQTHEFSATASVDIPAGTTVTVTGTAGTGLIVAPQAVPPPSTAGDGPADASGVGGNTGV